MRRKSDELLIIAITGRALACSAARAGLAVHVFDLFADADTRNYARTVCRVPGEGLRFNNARLLALLDEFCRDHPVPDIVVGSGFEDRPRVLDEIARRGRLFGNPAAAVDRAKDPRWFFGLLDTLDFPHPEIALRDPGGAGTWLLKRIGGAGGSHIRRWRTGEVVPRGWYVQHRITGRSCSVVFLADGRDVLILGYNETWTASSAASEFTYGGAVSRPELPQEATSLLEAAARQLTRALGLVGLCGLDAIVDVRGTCYLLELNPRPTSTFELHEGRDNLFVAHLDACQGRLPARLATRPRAAAHAVLYSEAEIRIPEGFLWPPWAADRPHPGSVIETGLPVCTVYAQGASAQAASQSVQERARRLRQAIAQARKVA
jgi:predicted ATP-grasp superfamily ATP-dependent carboligase